MNRFVADLVYLYTTPILPALLIYYTTVQVSKEVALLLAFLSHFLIAVFLALVGGGSVEDFEG